MKLFLTAFALLALAVYAPSQADTTYYGLRQAQNIKTGWGSPGDNKTINGNVLSINQTIFERGFTLHANGEATFSLDAKQKWLSFYTGIAGDMAQNSSVILSVELDGQEAYKSPLLEPKQEPVFVVLALNSCKNVRFVISDGGNGSTADHLVIANLRTTSDEEKPKPDAPIIAKLTPPTDIAPLVPNRGVASIAPAQNWDSAMVSGSGVMGALVYGRPDHETFVFDRAGLYLPQGNKNEVPNIARYLPEARKIIADALAKDGNFERGYKEADEFLGGKAREVGHSFAYTDPFHPGMVLRLNQGTGENLTNYARTENFETGEVGVLWRDGDTNFRRDLFVSRADNLIVLKLSSAGKAKINFSLAADPISNDKIAQTQIAERGWILAHNIYMRGDKTRKQGGYDVALRVVPQGGVMSEEDGKISVAGADSVLVFARLELLANSADNHLPQMRTALGKIVPNYDALLEKHAKIHGALFRRVSLDLGGARGRKVASERLLEEAARTKTLSPALAELLYDGGRYVILSATGEAPPNLQGIWTGTWQPSWSGDFTLDTNIQLAISHYLSSNTSELLQPYFNLLEGFLPDFRQNARNLYGARGIRAPLRASNNGLELHWPGFPAEFWNCGAGWLAHWYFDYYQFTGDRKFLRTRAVPFMKETALFYEDFLVLDATGKYRFRPTFSAENGSADNATQDIQVARELLTNLIFSCKTLGIEKENIEKWQAMLDKLPPLVYMPDGAIKEWAVPDSQRPENNNHRHASHLYDAFQDTGIMTEENNPKEWNGSIQALKNRLNTNGDDSSHGYMHLGLAAAILGQGDIAWSRVKIMATGRSIYPSMVTGHYGGPRTFNVDSDGALPEIMNSMLVQSQIGRLVLLPALPTDAMQSGELRGVAARGVITVNRLTWDAKEGHCEAILTSKSAQEIDLGLGRGLKVTAISANAKPLKVLQMGIQKWGARLPLPSGKPVTVTFRFTVQK